MTPTDCPQCGIGVLRVYASKRSGEHQIQHRRCDWCDHHDKLSLPADSIRRRDTYQGINIVKALLTDIAE